MIISTDKKAQNTHNTTLLSEFDKGGLVWPTYNMTCLTGLCVDVVRCIINDKKCLECFMISNAEGSASVRIIKYFMKKRIMKNPKLIQFHQTCDCCGKNRSESMIPKLINTLSNVCMNKLSTCLNRKTTISKITLSMVKEKVKKI